MYKIFLRHVPVLYGCVSLKGNSCKVPVSGASRHCLDLLWQKSGPPNDTRKPHTVKSLI